MADGRSYTSKGLHRFWFCQEHGLKMRAYRVPANSYPALGSKRLERNARGVPAAWSAQRTPTKLIVVSDGLAMETWILTGP